jgi:hypothetical protein
VRVLGVCRKDRAVRKGLRKNNFPCLGAETPVWQGARIAHTPRMERTSHAARRDGSTPKHGKLFLRKPEKGESL